VSFPAQKQVVRARLYLSRIYVSTVRTNQKEFSQRTSAKGLPSIIHIHFQIALNSKRILSALTYIHE
jgi:hypothetical protein